MPVQAIATPASAFAEDVLQGLTRRGQKTIPACWLYDAVGSSLFEVITLLPEYGLTRADGALLKSAAHEIITAAGHPKLIVELGSGTGSKTRHLLSEAAKRGEQVRYAPIDISRAALDCCEAALASLEGVSIEPIEADYLDGIDLALEDRRPGEQVLILFLGSTIGNFNREETVPFLRSIRQRVDEGDSLLLGADLVKPKATLLRAYDDSIGVTAAFNLNLLARMNRELDAEFQLAQFAHEARYDERPRELKCICARWWLRKFPSAR